MYMYLCLLPPAFIYIKQVYPVKINQISTTLYYMKYKICVTNVTTYATVN